MILERLILGDLQTNCYILADNDTKECAIFDPSAEADRIMSVINQHELKAKYIILTHVHIDHVMALDEIKKITGASVVVHTDEADLLNDITGTLAQLFNTAPPKTKADIKVSDGDTVSLGEKEIKFIHTPGHTIGCMCALCENMLISGDTLFSESIGRTDFPGGNHNLLISSIKNKLMSLNDEIRVYPGHGPSTTIGHERMYNPYL